jgi:hypothetical protein
MFIQFNRLFRAEDRAKPERFWNRLEIKARREILEEEGLSPEHIQNICSKNWKHLSEVERIWLFSPLLLASMEARQKSVQLVDELNSVDLKSPQSSGIE